MQLVTTRWMLPPWYVGHVFAKRRLLLSCKTDFFAFLYWHKQSVSVQEQQSTNKHLIVIFLIP